jgi:uncharacterized protein with HEPN domain
MTKDPRVYLAHIWECLGKIEDFTADGRARFFQDAMVQDAVLRNFEIIGEAAKRLDESYRQANPQIPWRALAGLRDVLIHQYEGVDLERVWTIIAQDLPRLRESISALLPPLDKLERQLAGEDESPSRGE